MKNILVLTFLLCLCFGCTKAGDKTGTAANDVTVAAPVLVAVTPNYAANNNAPVVSGTATPFLIVKIYSDSDCTTELASNVSDNLGYFEVTVSVADDSSTTMYGKAFNGTFASACSTTHVTYVEDSSPPTIPVVTSVSPVGPANNNNISVIGTGDANQTIKIFADSACATTAIGTGAANGSGNFSVSVTVADNSTNNLYAETFKANGNHSACSTTHATYIEDSTAPAAPVIVSSTPVSPSNSSTTPTLTGTAEANATVKIYTNNTCTSSVAATTTANGSGNFSAGVTVTTNSTNYFYATSTDASNNTSACSTATFTYIHDNTAPAKPILSATSPISPSDVNSPVIVGTAEANSTVKLYTNNTCTSAVLATDTANSSGNFAINATAAENELLTIYATATDLANNTSVCSSTTLPYQNYSVPTGMLFLQGTTTTAPSASTNFNQATAYSVKFTNVNEYHSDYYSHSVTTNSHQVTVKISGNYFLNLTVPLSSTVSAVSVKAEVRVNGTSVPQARLESGYISNSGSQTESSLHIATLLPGLTADDVIDVTVASAANAGVVTGTATLTMEYMSGSRNIFYATSTQTTNSTNINQSTSYPLEWTDAVTTAPYSHSNVTNTQSITLQDNGYYLIYVNIPVSSSTATVNVRATVRINGAIVTYGRASQGVIRGTAQTASSIHWAALIPNVTAGDILTVETAEEALAGTVTITSGKEASILVEKFSAPDGIHMSRTTTGISSTNWNTGTQNASWTTDDMTDSTYYSHSTSTNPDRITFNQAGDYLAILNMPTTATTSNTNWRALFLINALATTGAEAKTTYISNSSGHNESSNSMVFDLRKCSVNDYLTVQATREGSAGTVTSNGDSSLILIYKPNSTSP